MPRNREQMTPAGSLDKRIEIQAEVTPLQTDVLGASADRWSTVATRWGSIEPLAGRELFAAQQVQSNVTHRVRMRYWKDGESKPLSPRHRLRWNDRIFNVESVINPGEYGRTTLVEILAVEQV